MTNITLSIEDSIYQEMKKHSEIKWSEFVRKSIKQRLELLGKIEYKQESTFTMLASQEVLKKEWDNEFDDRWDNV